MTETTQEKKTYQGSCHCQAVRYEVDMALGEVIACNCSICGRSGTLLAFVPMSDFRLLAGKENLTPYTFNKHAIQHSFCKTCGIKSFAEGESPHGKMAAINARCLEGVDIEKLKINHYDGKNM